jgi:hypothetical protein
MLDSIMPHLSISDDGLRFGRYLVISFHRTVRVPEIDGNFPLPPTFGRFPLQSVASADDTIGLDLAIPMRKREALWIAFEGPDWRPNAVKVGLGNVNAIDGGRWDDPLHDDPQNYVVTGGQFWLDGVNAGDGFVRQFVATTYGKGMTVEEQLGSGHSGDIRLEVFDPKPGLFPDKAPPTGSAAVGAAMPMGAPPLGLGAGGRIKQKIHKDPHGVGTWDPGRSAVARVRLLDPGSFAALTGRTAPPSPIDASAYIQLGLPWFDLYEDDVENVAAAKALRQLKSLGQSEQDENSGVKNLTIHRLRRDG